MDLKNLKTFIQTAELGSFTKASEILGYSQSTVSFQIKQLETELNTPLFERINHTVALTARGREILAYAHQIIRMTDEMTHGASDTQSAIGHVRLAMADSLCASLLSERFCAFREQYPGISLKIIAAGTKEMFRLINHNEVDAILTLDNHIYNTDYVIVKEEKAAMHFTAGTDSPLSKKTLITIEELIQQPFILTEEGMSYRRLLDEKLAEMSLEINPVLEIGSTDLICRLVEQGIGISFLPDYVTTDRAASGRLVYLNVKGFEIDVWKQLLYHRDKWVSPQMSSVLQYCISREFSK